MDSATQIRIVTSRFRGPNTGHSTALSYIVGMSPFPFELIVLAFSLPPCVATALPYIRHEAWWIRGLDFPRLQIATWLGLALLAQLALWPQAPWQWALFTLALGALVWQLWWILPYTRLWPREVYAAQGTGPRVRILTANVLTPNRQADKLLALVHEHQPDVLVTLESDQWWQNQLDSLRNDYPHCIACPLDNLYGMHVYSRLPLKDARTEFLVENDVPSMHAALELKPGLLVRLHWLHPAPPSPTENEASSERDAELIMVARSVRDEEGPVVVTGDLNDVAWSATTRLFRKISGLLDPRVGRGMYNTFHADYAVARWPLDHLFHSEHFTLCDIRRLPSIGSDHFPLLTTLQYQPRRGHTQNGLDADHDDHQWAQDKLDQQNASADDVPQPDNSPAKSAANTPAAG